MTKKELETKVDELTASVAALTELVNGEANANIVKADDIKEALECMYVRLKVLELTVQVLRARGFWRKIMRKVLGRKS